MRLISMIVIDFRCLCSIVVLFSPLDVVSLYEWADPNVPPFDHTDPSWCKTDTTGLGYFHPFDEPTRRMIDNEMEKCVIFRRGRTTIPMYCLDDVFCSEQHSVICERCRYLKGRITSLSFMFLISAEYSIINFPDALDIIYPRMISASSSYRSSTSLYGSSSQSSLRPASNSPIVSSIVHTTRTTTKKPTVTQRNNATANANGESNKDPNLSDVLAMKDDEARATSKIHFSLKTNMSTHSIFVSSRKNQNDRSNDSYTFPNGDDHRGNHLLSQMSS